MVTLAREICGRGCRGLSGPAHMLVTEDGLKCPQCGRTVYLDRPVARNRREVRNLRVPYAGDRRGLWDKHAVVRPVVGRGRRQSIEVSCPWCYETMEILELRKGSLWDCRCEVGHRIQLAPDLSGWV